MSALYLPSIKQPSKATHTHKTLMFGNLLALFLVACSPNTFAVLPNGTTLTIEPGSKFVLGVQGADVVGENNIIVGTAPGDTGTGSHNGLPLPTDIGAVTKPWGFFNNTGYDYIEVGFPIVEGNENELDFTGWSVTWAGIPRIPMGGCFLVPGGCDTNGDGEDDLFDTGIATVVWSGISGDPYTLTFNSHVPVGDPTGFGGVAYRLELQGVVNLPGTPPSTNPDSAKTIIGNSVIIDVLANDSSADGLDLDSVTVVTPAANGSTDDTRPDGTIEYTPDTVPDFVGIDSFEYTVDSNLGATSADTNVDIDVQVNVAPVANNDSLVINTAALDNGAGATTIDVLSNDIDVNNSQDLPGGIDSSTVSVLSQPAIGTCTANPDGTITYSQQVPSVGETDTCTYQVNDIDAFDAPLTSNIGTVDINVSAIQSDWPAALPANIIPFLEIDPGIPGNPNDTSVPALGGSYFTMQVSSDVLIYTVMIPGPAGGVVVDHEQPVGNSHTGSPIGNEQTAIDLGWNFFGNTGFHTGKNGGIVGNPDGTLQFAGAGGIGNSQGRWIITWNGIPEIDLGGSSAFPEDLGFGTIICDPAPCGDQSSYALAYAAHVPPGDPSGFGGVPYTLTLEGTVRFIDDQPKASNGNIVSINRMTADGTGVVDTEVDQQCVGDCFDYTIENVTDPSVKVVLPLAGGVPLNPSWRILDGGAWRSLDTGGGDTLKSAALGANDTECPDPGDAAYSTGADGKPVIGHQCIELTIADNGPNDKDPAVGTITDPAGMGGGGAAGGVAPQKDNRDSDTSGCAIGDSNSNLASRSEWWLLAGFVAWLGWKRRSRKLH